MRHTVLVKELLNSFVTEFLSYFFQSEYWFLYMKDLKPNTVLQKHFVFIFKNTPLIQMKVSPLKTSSTSLLELLKKLNVSKLICQFELLLPKKSDSIAAQINFSYQQSSLNHIFFNEGSCPFPSAVAN